MNPKKILPLIFLILSVFFLFCCSQSEKDVPIEEAPKMGRYLSSAAPDTDGISKILVYYDMEGISGQNDMRSLSFGNEEYNQAREWLTNDVNAVIDGLFAGGADEVHVVDAHGSGNPDPDILIDKMDNRAELVSKDKPFEAYVELTEEGIYDGVAVVCMHSKTPARLDQLDGVPGITYKDQTVTFNAENFQEAYDGITALVSVATRGYIRLLANVLNSQENADKIGKEYGEKIDSTWVEVESGLWKPPAPPAKKDTKRKYFGYR